ncbi:MAG: hypothetical protein K2K23_00300 [Muribaculaceae bacterium]|nr:hypothetical protein [Muribaculaceae bacterium]
MKSYFRYIYKLMSSASMAALIVLSLVMGCKERVDPKLSEIDSKMEEHPDSALMLLDSYHLSANASDYDRAYYGMLLTHARYKNFIDETNDSLISASAEYFLKHDCKEQASRSLFLKGMIQRSANSLGESAVSFSKGLDIAKAGKQYMWAGQCARGLRMIYESLHDGSAQVKYACESRKAFLKCKDKSWQDYSEYELAIALNNNCKYEEALSVLDSLDKQCSIKSDTLMLTQIAQLRGMALLGLGKYEESLKNYEYSCELNHEILCEKDFRNIRIALYNLYGDSIPENYLLLLNNIEIKNTPTDAYDVLVNEGDYKKAYESLERYKDEQDSVLSIIFKNNVSESVNQYETIKSILAAQKLRNERLSYCFIFLLILMIGIFSYWRYREKIHKEESKRLKIEADMESLRSDLMSQLDSAKKELKNASKESECEKAIGFEKIIRQRYAEANQLCDDYYQGCGISKNKSNDVDAKINSIIAEFKDNESMYKIAEYVDGKSGGLYSSFKKDFFHLSSECHRLFLYLMLGFSARTLSVIIGQSINAIYIKKSRLKSKITQSDLSLKDEYLKFF